MRNFVREDAKQSHKLMEGSTNKDKPMAEKTIFDVKFEFNFDSSDLIVEVKWPL